MSASNQNNPEDHKDDGINPYRATLEVAERSDGLPAEARSQRTPSLAVTALRWTLICGISSVPSFVAARAQGSSPPLAMIIGVLVFAAGYTWLDRWTAPMAFRSNPDVARTLKIAYASRIIITVVYPVGFMIDILCGLISVPISAFLLGSEAIALRSFGGVLITTLIQGLTLNAVLAVYALLVYPTQMWVSHIASRLRDYFSRG